MASSAQWDSQDSLVQLYATLMKSVEEPSRREVRPLVGQKLVDLMWESTRQARKRAILKLRHRMRHLNPPKVERTWQPPGSTPPKPSP